MSPLWLLAVPVAVPLVLGRILHYGHRRCCDRHAAPLRLEVTVTKRQA
jgi:hypothetical protein